MRNSTVPALVTDAGAKYGDSGLDSNIHGAFQPPKAEYPNPLPNIVWRVVGPVGWLAGGLGKGLAGWVWRPEGSFARQGALGEAVPAGGARLGLV